MDIENNLFEIDIELIIKLFPRLPIDKNLLVKNNSGISRNVEKKYYYEDNTNNLIYIKCSDIFTCLNLDFYKNMIRKNNLTLTYHKATGYVYTRITKNITDEYLKTFLLNADGKVLLHKLILKYHIDNDDSLLSVDHINMNKLDNRIENLRWATQGLQNSNRTIYNKNKHPLQAAVLKEVQKYEPELLVFPTYVHIKNKGRNKKKIEDCTEDNILEELSWSFCIDGHPKRKLPSNHPLKDIIKCDEWTGSEKKTLSTYDKYLQMKEKLNEIESDIPYKLKNLPEYIFLEYPKNRNPSIVFEYRNNNIRVSKSQTIKLTNDIKTEYDFYEKIFKNTLLEFIEEKKKIKELPEDFELTYSYI